MSILEAFMAPHPNGLHLTLLVIGLVAAWFAVRPDFGDCRCPSGDCPAWERKAGLDPISPDCPIHGEEVKAA